MSRPADLDFGKGPAGTPTGRLVQTISPDVLAGENMVRLGNSWMAYSQPYGATISGGAVTTLPRSGWTVTTVSTEDGGSIANMLDGDPNTRWSSGHGQAPGDWVQVDLGAQTTFSQISLDVGPNTGDFVNRYEVQVSSDGSTWNSIARGAGTTGIMTIPLPTTTARFIKLVSLASSGSWWSITELNVGVAPGATSGDSGNLRTASTTIHGPDGVPAQVTSRYNAGNGAATVAFPLPGFNYAYALPPTAAVTFATWPAS